MCAAHRYKKYKVLMLAFNETLDQLAMANSMCCYGRALMGEDGHVLRTALDFEVDGQWKIGRLKMTLKK